MRILSALLLSFIVIFSGTNQSKAQTIELLAGNTLNGAMNGTLLGGATMALQNDSDFRPLQVGLGLGTLYGLGAGAYDIASGNGQELVVSGMFNKGNNTSIIVLLDTFYGAAAGAVIGTSIMLIADEPIVEGLQYGSATGAWIGFGVGMIDAFVFSERGSPTASSIDHTQNRNLASGLVGININDHFSLGLVSPSIVHTYQQNGSTKIHTTVDVFNFNLQF
jgi:hypothetical protein